MRKHFAYIYILGFIYTYYGVVGRGGAYFPSYFVMFPASCRTRRVGGAVSRCSFPQAFIQATVERRGPTRFISFDERRTRRHGNPSGMERARSCTWHRRSEIYCCGRSRGGSSWYSENERRNYRSALPPRRCSRAVRLLTPFIVSPVYHRFSLWSVPFI